MTKCERCLNVNTKNTLYCEKCGANLFKSKLRVVHESGLNRTHYLFSQDYRIGRDQENDIVIVDASVSRHHAELKYEHGSFCILDHDSKNGSLLNNLQFKRSKLQNHDCLQLGGVVLHFYSEEQSLQPRSNFDTIQFVQNEYFRLAENRHTNVTTNDVLNTMLDLALSLVHADQAAILEYDDSHDLHLKIGKNLDGVALDGQRGLFEGVCESQVAKIACRDEVLDNDGGAAGDPDWEYMAFPLMAIKGNSQKTDELGRNGVLGVCYLNHNKTQNRLSNRKRELLTALMQQIALAVENELLYKESHANRRIRQEIKSAKIIQAKLLPTTHPDIGSLEIRSFVEPCETISGDYFDIIPVSDEFVAIAIGDICGKGVPAALLSSTAQAAIRSQLEYSTSPREIVDNLNRLLIQSTTKSVFLTLFFGILNVTTNELVYINAGHLPPVFVSKAQKLSELSGTTPPLGILEEEFQAERSVQFEPGDLLLMYTDGLIESQNSKHENYGRKRLLKLVRTIFKASFRDYELDAVVSIVKKDFLSFIGDVRQSDDLTLLAVKRKELV